MVGNAIQSLYLSLRDYPTAAALSFMLMAVILVIVVDLHPLRRLGGADGRRGGGDVAAPGSGCATTRVSIWAALAVAYLLVPIALIAVFSFNDPEGKFNYTWSGFTTRALERRLRDPGAQRRAS